MSTRTLRSIALLGSLVILAAAPLAAEASHSWNGYHWARTSNPFTVEVIDSMTPDRDPKLALAISDWNRSSVLNVIKDGPDDTLKVRRRCPTVSGKVRACNANYGNNGWLGLAQIWLRGGHIGQGTAKMKIRTSHHRRTTTRIASTSSVRRSGMTGGSGIRTIPVRT